MSQIIDEPYRKQSNQVAFVEDGAIEAAHRTVLQKRMKQSGQRWSKREMSNMIKLRTTSMSGYWNEIQLFIRNAA